MGCSFIPALSPEDCSHRDQHTFCIHSIACGSRRVLLGHDPLVGASSLRNDMGLCDPGAFADIAMIPDLGDSKSHLCMCLSAGGLATATSAAKLTDLP